MESELSNYPVVLTIPVAWGDMDSYAHVNNTVYFRWFESARIAYAERIGAYEQGVANTIGPILAATSCRFKAPVRYPDTVHVGARIREIGEDRFTMDYAAFSERLSRIAATGDGTVVIYDYRAMKKTALPTEWRERIAAIEARS